MPLSVPCPLCQTPVTVPDGQEGRKKVVACPDCGTPINLAGLAARRPGAAPVRDDEGEDRLDKVEDDEEDDRPRGRRKRSRDDDPDEEDRPRGRGKRSRDDDPDEEDRPARRKKKSPGRKPSGGGIGLIIAGVVGVALLLLAGCGIGGYFLFFAGKGGGGLLGGGESRNLTNDNLHKLKTNTPLKEIEAVLGPGTTCTLEDVKAALVSPRPVRGRLGNLPDPSAMIEGTANRVGVVSWYRWKNGGLALYLGVDAGNVVRVSATVSTENGGHSTYAGTGGNSLGLGTPPGAAK